MLGPAHPAGGVGRYRMELERRLAGRVEFSRCGFDAGFARGVPLLRQLPLSAPGIDRSAPVHIPQIVGTGILRFRRLPPTVVTVHDLSWLQWPGERRMLTLGARLLLWLDFGALARAERLIAVSHATAAVLVNSLGIDERRITVTQEGVDHQMFTPVPDARARVTARWGVADWDDWRTIAVVGSELPRKNLALVLRALGRYRSQGRGVRLLKAGAPGGARWRDQTSRLVAQLGVGDRVHFVDGATDADLAALYGAADAYVCPSHIEGFSLPTVEAMASGAAVVVAPSGALPEVVGDAGLVLGSSSTDELVHALDRLFSDSELTAELRQRSRRRAERFSWHRMADQTYAVYQSLVEAR